MAMIKMTAFVFYFVLSFLSIIQSQFTNDTALLWTGKKLDNNASFGLTLGNPSVYLQQISEQNDSTASHKFQLFQSSSNVFQSIAYDARTTYIGISEINFRALLIFNISDIWNKTSNIRPKYTFESFPLSSNIPGLAFASNFNLLYWVDATFQYIGVVDFTTSQWTKIAIVTPGTPSSVAVHERQRLVFWSVLADKPKIERSNLFGGERITIVDVGLTQPVNLVIDKQSEKLFWLDVNLKSCAFDGTNIVTYSIPYNNLTFSSFAIYKDLIISTSSNGNFHSYEIHQNNVLRDYISFHYTNQLVIYSMSLDSLEFVSNDTSPCTNNTCDQLCFPASETNYVCKCSFGLSLGPDSKTCNPGDLMSGQLLVGDYTGGVVYQVNPNSGIAETILNIQPNRLSDMAYLNYLNEKSIYYVKEDQRLIMRYNISSRKSSLYYYSASKIFDMLVDQHTGNLYFANYKGQIYKITASQNVRIILDDWKLNIYKLYIHPQTRRLFYSDCAQKTVVEINIETDTKNNTFQTGICVASMAFDFDANFTYYGDNNSTLWRHDLNNPTNALLRMNSDVKLIRDMTSDKNSLYLVEYSHAVFKVDKRSFTKSILTQNIFRNASEIILIHKPSERFQNNLLSYSFGSICLLTSMLLISTH